MRLLSPKTHSLPADDDEDDDHHHIHDDGDHDGDYDDDKHLRNENSLPKDTFSHSYWHNFYDLHDDDHDDHGYYIDWDHEVKGSSKHALALKD